MKEDPKQEVTVDTTTAKCYFLISNLMDEIINELHVKMPETDKSFEDGLRVGYNEALDKVFYRLYEIEQDIDGYLGYETGFKKKQ